jgi:hypothetical protein
MKVLTVLEGERRTNTLEMNEAQFKTTKKRLKGE